MPSRAQTVIAKRSAPDSKGDRPPPSFVRRFRPVVCKHLLLVDPAEINAAIEELWVLVERCEHLRLTVDQWASPARQIKELIKFRDRADFSVNALLGLEPATLIRLMAHHPGGELRAIQQKPTPMEIRAAISSALVELGPARRGRPEASGLISRKQLAIGLAYEFGRLRGPPKRKEGWGSGNKRDRGEFRAFVDAFLKQLPKHYRQFKTKPGLKSGEWIVREGIDHRRRWGELVAAARRAVGAHLINPTLAWTVPDKEVYARVWAPLPYHADDPHHPPPRDVSASTLLRQRTLPRR